MAITYENAGQTPFSTSTTNFSFTPDAGVQSGDVFIVAVNHRNNSTVTPPASGTAEVPINKAEMTAGDRYVTVFAWVASSTSTTPVGFTLNISTPGSVVWLRFRGVDTSDPVNVSSPGTYNYPTPNTVAAITTTVANTYVVGGIMCGSGSAVPGVPGSGGWTSRATATVATGLIATKGIQASAGSTGSAAFTTSPTTINTIAWQLALRPAAAASSPALTHAIVGDIQPDGFTVQCRASDTTSMRLKVATNSGLTTGVVFGSAVTPDGSGCGGPEITGLADFTDYYYGVEMTGPGGTVTTTGVGPIRTAPTPGDPTSFVAVFGSCHDQGETTSQLAYTRMLARNPDLFFHLGDFHYADNSSTAQASHLTDITTQITTQTGLKSLLAAVPTTYSHSDHDSGGNTSFPGSQTAPNRAATLQAFPYPTRPDSNGLYHSFVYGRVRFIILDTRYFAVNDGSTRLGSAQLAWLADELMEPEPLKVIVQESPWIDERTPDPIDDTWEFFDAERTTIGNMILTASVGQIIMWNGDAHCLSADDGSGNPFGGFPMMAAAAFNNFSSMKTVNGETDWSEGQWPTNANIGASLVQQYGHVAFTDDGSTITAAFTGYDSGNTSRVTLTVTVETPNEGSAAFPFAFAVAAEGTRASEGSAALAFSFGVTAAGERESSGSAALGFTFGLAAEGTTEKSGSAVLGYGFGITAAGERESAGSAALGFSFGVQAAGERDSLGSAELGHVWAITAEGEAPGVDSSFGSAEFGFGFGLTAEGARESAGSASLGFTFGVTAAGERESAGSASLGHTWSIAAEGEAPSGGGTEFGFTFAILAAGERESRGSAGLGHVWEIQAAGEAPNVPGSGGSAEFDYSFGLAAAGERESSGSAALGFLFTLGADGSRPSRGACEFGFGFGITATGSAPSVDPSEGGAVFGHSWGVAAEGARESAGTATLTFSFAIFAQGPVSIIDLPDILTATVVPNDLTACVRPLGGTMPCVDTMTEKEGDTRTREIVLNRDLTGVPNSNIDVFVSRRGVLVDTITPSIVDATGGVIGVTFDGTLERGSYKMEVQVTQGSSISTHPTDGWIVLNVVPDLAD